MAEVKVGKTATAIVDDSDVGLVASFRWGRSGTRGLYAATRTGGRTVYMHRLLLSAPNGVDVTHINGQKMDNRRENIRLATELPRSYGTYHWRVRNIRGRPKACEDCGTTDPSRRYEWASLTKNYSDPFDYKRLCQPCHNRFDNMAARLSAYWRGRPRPQIVGVKHPAAKLTEAEVVSIRQRNANGTSLGVLALEFGMSKQNVWRIVLRRIWKHLP